MLIIKRYTKKRKTCKTRIMRGGGGNTPGNLHNSHAQTVSQLLEFFQMQRLKEAGRSSLYSLREGSISAYERTKTKQAASDAAQEAARKAARKASEKQNRRAARAKMKMESKASNA